MNPNLFKNSIISLSNNGSFVQASVLNSMPKDPITQKKPEEIEGFYERRLTRSFSLKGASDGGGGGDLFDTDSNICSALNPGSESSICLSSREDSPEPRVADPDSHDQNSIKLVPTNEKFLRLVKESYVDKERRMNRVTVALSEAEVNESRHQSGFNEVPEPNPKLLNKQEEENQR